MDEATLSTFMNMMGASGMDSRAALLSMLAESSDLDPMTRMLMTQSMAQQADDETADEPEPSNEADYTDPFPDDAERAAESNRHARKAQQLAHKVQHLLEHVELLEEYIDVLEDRLGWLASALGACPVCLGEDEDCRLCHGEGGPGTFPPDRRVLDELVKLLLRHSKQSRFRPRSSDRSVYTYQ